MTDDGRDLGRAAFSLAGCPHAAEVDWSSVLCCPAQAWAARLR